MAEPTLTSNSDDLTAVRARAMCAAGRLAWFERDLRKARALTEESAALFRQVNDSLGLLNSLSSLIMVLTWQGDDDGAQALCREGMGIVRSIPGEERANWLPVLTNFGWAVCFTSSPRAMDDAWSVNREVEALAREAHDQRGLAWALDCLGMCCYYRGDLNRAREFLMESVALFRELGELWAVAHIGFGLGNISIEQGLYDDAVRYIKESLDLIILQNNWVGYPYTLEMYAYLAIAQGQAVRAAKLLGATEKIREAHTSARQPYIQSLFERNMSVLRTQLPTEELEVAWQQGRSLSSDALLAYAMDVPGCDTSGA